MIEQLAGIPVRGRSCERVSVPEADPGSRPSLLVVPVSQSGETADTLAALREGREQGARVLAISNTRESTIARESDDVLYTHAGPEIGVASTKCFTAQVVALYLLALKLAILRGRLSESETREHLAGSDSSAAPRRERSADRREDRTHRPPLLPRHATSSSSGEGIMYPIALEGALKLKEISYIHAEGYAAGEMKHGPIALIDEHMPVVVIATRGGALREGDFEPRAGSRAGRQGDRHRDRRGRGDRRQGLTRSSISPDLGDAPDGRSSRYFHCNFSPTTWRSARARTSISPATWRRASRSNSGLAAWPVEVQECVDYPGRPPPFFLPASCPRNLILRVS